MAEHPILFSGPMVRAILDGHKTQTRRVIRLPSLWNIPPAQFYNGRLRRWGCTLDSPSIACPYGVPGDLLWVRETWQPCRDGDTDEVVVVYRADWERHDKPDGPRGGKWRPSIHMPRWASRITLRLTNVRIEQVQKISVEDARAEGCYPTRQTSSREMFISLWNSINAKRGYGWDANPWVWALTFQVAKGA